jgi:virginiamycin B lyase
MTTLGEVKDYPLKKGYRQVQGITTGPDGAIWFTETHANTVSRLTLPNPSADGKRN